MMLKLTGLQQTWLPRLAAAAAVMILLVAAGCTGPASPARRSSADTAISPGGASTSVANATSPPSASPVAAAAPAPVQPAAAEAEAVETSEPATVAASATAGDPLDWPFWRGPQYNGHSPATGLIDDFDPDGGEGSNVKWKREDLGGRSSPIYMNGRLYTLTRAERETPREGEKVVCLDAETGETLWENRFNVWLSDVPDTRVGWSSVVGDPATGRVYALGVCGFFQCLDGETGERIWSVPMHERFGLLSTYGGRTNSPIVVDDLVIISAVVIGWGDMAKPAHRFIGFDKNNGDVVWFNGTRLLPDDTTYSSPALTVINGKQAMVFGSGDGAVWALEPRTGRPIWQYELSMRGLNVSPVVVGDRVFTGQSEENLGTTAMGAVVAIDATGTGNITETGRVWKLEELMMGKSSPIVIGERLYCFDDRAKLHILDTNTGQPVASRKALGTVMRASPLYADGKIYANTANGRWYVLQPDEKQGVKIINRGRFPSGEECHASPICSHGKIYMQTTGALYCLADPNKTPGVGDLPAPLVETPVGDDDQPAHVQISPAELLMMPGRIAKFNVRLFNERGQFLRESEAEFTLDGPGEMSPDGTFLAPGEAEHTATIVHAKVGDLTGRARVRVVPPLPWSFDFDNLTDPPVTWVGARYRHVLRDIDGNKAMVKITTIPKGARSRCWFGHSELSNYTIQADVRGTIGNGRKPDIGLVAQGYVLDLMGAGDRLQIRSWVPQLRMAQTIDFPWKEDTWYTMKLQAAIVEQPDAGGATVQQAVLKGKVWPRGEDEPEAWAIEAVDESPNLQGSPGLFGNAKDAELFLDNIQVFANEAS